MQHMPSVRLPSEHKWPNWATVLIALLALALIAVVALQTTSPTITVAARASSGVYVNPELWTYRNWRATHPVQSAPYTAVQPAQNPELAVAQRYQVAHAARLESQYLAQNPELALVRAHQLVAQAQAEHDFLATNPEVALHRNLMAAER